MTTDSSRTVAIEAADAAFSQEKQKWEEANIAFGETVTDAAKTREDFSKVFQAEYRVKTAPFEQRYQAAKKDAADKLAAARERYEAARKRRDAIYEANRP